MGFSHAGLCKRGRPGRFRCGDHGVKNIAFNAAGTHLAGSWRRRTASRDSSCYAYQMLITECVTSQPEACYPWPQKLIDIGSWTASENLFTQWQDLFPVFLSTNLLLVRDLSMRTTYSCHFVHGFLSGGFPSLSPCRLKRSYQRSRTHLAVAATTWGMSIFLESDIIVAWMAPEEVSAPTRKHAICRGPPSPMYPWSNKS